MASPNIARQYYFAFGSNMCLAQMAERCPGSTFIGRATLQGYRWQINERHVANIVKIDDESQFDVVEGLVFSITDKDRQILDRKEGIKLGVYERVNVVVLLKRHGEFAGRKTAFVCEKLRHDVDGETSETGSRGTARQGSGKDQQVPLEACPRLQSQEKDDRSEASPNTLRQSSSAMPSERSTLSGAQDDGAKMTETITYLSTKYAEDGLIRKEYVQRMDSAMRDALKLGVSHEYFQKSLQPYVHGPISPPDEEAPSQRSSSSTVAKKDGPGEGETRTVQRARLAAGPESQSGRRLQPHDPGSRSERLDTRRPKHPRGKTLEERDEALRNTPGTGIWNLGTSIASAIFGPGQPQGSADVGQEHRATGHPKS